ncbi:Imm8 family immunity protein [Frondihabitans sp. 762G35]|uniref:Imm8 family immunity protein n=1 Tax=Frondihabitans sp. 762G35 TaxID=1446794 RepID=UPI001C1FE083|nr:Imm8 family immunity protein [Frondihabitans sp. 762G35]
MWTIEGDDLDSIAPEQLTHIAQWIRVLAGPDDGPGEESFDLLVCTPSWLAQELSRGPAIVGRHHLIIERWDAARVRAVVTDLFTGEEADDWQDLGPRLGRLGHWEFEDYRQFEDQGNGSSGGPGGLFRRLIRALVDTRDDLTPSTSEWRSMDSLGDEPGGSPLRKLVARATDTPYRSFASLADAEQTPSSWVVFEGDDGGQIYAVFRVRDIECSEGDLSQLLADIDALFWADETMARLAFEAHEEGGSIPGGMGGGVARSGGWVHPVLVAASLEGPIRDVVAGRSKRLHGG